MKLSLVWKTDDSLLVKRDILSFFGSTGSSTLKLEIYSKTVYIA